MLYDKIEIQEGVTYAKFSVGYNPNDWYIQHFFPKISMLAVYDLVLMHLVSGMNTLYNYSTATSIIKVC